MEALRDKLQFIEQKHREEEEAKKRNEQEMMEREVKLKKKLKEIQRLSYDYSGDFFNTNPPSQNSTLSGAAFPRFSYGKEKTQTEKEHKKILHSLRMKTVSTVIENERLEERKERIKAGRILTESMEGYFKDSNAVKFTNEL